MGIFYGGRLPDRELDISGGFMLVLTMYSGERDA
jgi:hypothetical protein